MAALEQQLAVAKAFLQLHALQHGLLPARTMQLLCAAKSLRAARTVPPGVAGLLSPSAIARL